MSSNDIDRDVVDTIATCETLINDVIINVRSDEESAAYNRRLKQLCRVKALLLTAPDLVTVLRELLNCCELNLDDLEPGTVALLERAQGVLKEAQA